MSRRMPLTCRSFHFLFVFLLCLLPWPSFAQEQEQEGERTLTEKTIYVPYDKLADLFEDDGRGVFLPYKEFIELWQNLTPALGKEPPEKPPVDGVLVAAEYAGRVESGVAILDATLEFRALKEGYSVAPLGAGQLFISDARLAAFMPAPGSARPDTQGFIAEVNGQTSAILTGPGDYRFRLTLMVPVTDEPGRKVLRFKGPRASVSRFRLDTPDQDVQFSLNPASAYTQEDTRTGGTRLSAFFGASNEITVAWSPRRAESGQPAMVFADVRQRVHLAEASTRVDTTFNLQVLLSGLDEVTVELPAEAQVLQVQCANMKSWNSRTAGTRQEVAIVLHSPAENNLAVSLTYEILADTPTGTRSIPLEVVAGARRQSGVISISAQESLQMRPGAPEGLSQTALPNLNPMPQFSYRYLRTPYRLDLDVTETLPEIHANVRTRTQAAQEKWLVQSRLDLDVRKAGIFGVRVRCPENYRDPEVSSDGDRIEDYRVVQTEDGRILEVDLRNRTMGAFSLHLQSEQLWTSPEETRSATVTLPVFTLLGAERIEGYYALDVHPSLETTVLEDTGAFRKEELRNLGELPAPRPDLETTFSHGFRFQGEASPTAVVFTRRKPRVKANVLTLVEVRESFARYAWNINYTIEYAGVDRFAISLPNAIADEVHITSAKMREKTKTVEGPRTTWTILLQTKVQGAHSVFMTWEKPYESAGATAASSASNTASLPVVIAHGVLSQNGQVALLKDGNLEVSPGETPLEVIDNSQLDAWLNRPGVFMAYKYDTEPDPASEPLALTIVRHAYVEVPASVVDAAMLKTVVSPEGAQTCEVVYLLKNKRAQYLELELPEGARILSDILVGTRTETPSIRESDGRILIRLPASGNVNSSTPVQFLYEIAGSRRKPGLFGKYRIEPPRLYGTKVLQTWWQLYLPEGYDYTRFGGAMRERLPDTYGWHRARPYFAWATPNAGIAAPVPQVAFQRPPAPPGGSGLNLHVVEQGLAFDLHRLDEPSLITAHYRRRVLTVILEILAFVIAIVLGVQLVRRLGGGRLAYCVTAGVAAVILSLLVSPRAAGPWQWFYSGVLVLAVVWGARHLHRMWKNRPPRPPRPSRSPRPPQAPPPDTAPRSPLAAAPAAGATAASQSPAAPTAPAVPPAAPPPGPAGSPGADAPGSNSTGTKDSPKKEA